MDLWARLHLRQAQTLKSRPQSWFDRAAAWSTKARVDGGVAGGCWAGARRKSVKLVRRRCRRSLKTRSWGIAARMNMDSTCTPPCFLIQSWVQDCIQGLIGHVLTKIEGLKPCFIRRRRLAVTMLDLEPIYPESRKMAGFLIWQNRRKILDPILRNDLFHESCDARKSQRKPSLETWWDGTTVAEWMEPRIWPKSSSSMLSASMFQSYLRQWEQIRFDRHTRYKERRTV